MRALLCLVSVLCVTALAADVLKTAPKNDADWKDLFNHYVKAFNKQYAGDEFVTRFAMFKASVARVVAHNTLPDEQRAGTWFGLTTFSDLSPAEFHERTHSAQTREMLKAQMATGENGRSGKLPEVHVADAVDWRKTGFVPKVWRESDYTPATMLSVLAAIDTEVSVAFNESIEVDEEQLIKCLPDDCVEKTSCLPNEIYDYLVANGACDAFSGDCSSPCRKMTYKVSGYTNVTCQADWCYKILPGTEDDMITATNSGVLTVAIEADSDIFQDYTSGVISDPSCGTDVDTIVAVVGYNTVDDVDYWIVRNNWGADWGDGGYVYIARGKNVCGIATFATLSSVPAPESQ